MAEPAIAMPSFAECEPLITPSDPDADESWEESNEEAPPWEEEASWARDDEIRRRCAEQLRARASLVADLFNAGDCESLAGLVANSPLRLGEQALIGFMLTELGDARGLGIFLRSFDLYDDGVMPPVLSHLPNSECGHSEAWWAPEAPGTCIRYRPYDSDLCSPPHCEYSEGLLLYAADQGWPGARAKLLEQALVSDGEVPFDYCRCGLRSPSTKPADWYAAVKNDRQRQWAESCFRYGPFDPNHLPCRTVIERENPRRCGEASGRDAALRLREQERTPAVP